MVPDADELKRAHRKAFVVKVRVSSISLTRIRGKFYRGFESRLCATVTVGSFEITLRDPGGAISKVSRVEIPSFDPIGQNLASGPGRQGSISVENVSFW